MDQPIQLECTIRSARQDNPNPNNQPTPKKNKGKKKKNIATYKAPTRCVCPRCSTQHTKMMFWTGNGHPRVYCPECQHNEEVCNPETIYCVNHRAVRNTHSHGGS